ncbi:TIGR00297 family protein [Parasynechococcus sp.]|uniref:TIGR00297 family protein n=1 Tax=Parasynechococcus sp. TaxID=3101203 RepID=UPI003703F6CC
MVWLQALIVNTVLIALAQRLPLLTRWGWVHAGILGTVLWGSLGWTGWLSVVLYLGLGSAVTKLGFSDKQRRGLAEARGGCRSPLNVWGSAATGASLALLIAAGLEPKPWLLAAFAASFAAKLADTFGSEIGKRWGRTPRLITTLRRVEPGTEGAISMEGTLASAVGSLLMAVVMWALALLPSLSWMWLVAVVGLVATLAESVLGAVAQTRLSWMSNELVNALQTSFAAVLMVALVALIP